MDVEATLGALAIGLLAVAVAPMADALVALVLLAISAALALGIAAAADAGVAATPFEVVAWASAGALFARVFAERALAIGVPLLVGAIDVASVGGILGPPGSSVPVEVPGGGDPLSFALPGTGLASPVVEVTLVVFLAASAVWARRLARGPGRTWSLGAPLALALVPAIAVLVASSTDRAVPSVALLGVVALAVQGTQLHTGRPTVGPP